ncbi:hypothetical protein WMF26_30525 [Sorangium sp. So ce185]|uniref:hypothetical protein n=1 Tax=Sorangium sp. So ce185 TaxID=3133287 RepID=UPI003F5F9FAB
MSSRLLRTVSPFVVVSAMSLAACQVEISLGGANTSSSSSSGVGGSGGGGVGGSDVAVSSSSVVTSSASGVVNVDWPEFTADKVDVLFVVDNSGSMADKQQILRLATADLVSNIVNPICVNPSGVPVSDAEQPATGFEACPAGTARVRNPVHDMHIGVISSSLGGHGSSACPAMTSPSNVDMAHLLARSNESSSNDLPTYQDRGFLVWDPAGAHDPAGDSDVTTLHSKLSAIVAGVGQAGCGFEAPLESMYRFLADPEPYERIEIRGDVATPMGVDETLLTQRRNFLRPDSLLLIVMLSDENDCSIRDEGRNYLVAETRNGFRLWRPRSECAIDPNHACCKSCSQNQDGCPPDPACTGSDGFPARLSASEDPVNSRCWDQKRRFGFDFLYPLERYTNALSSPYVATRAGDLVPNPIFTHPDDGNTLTRGPQHVIFTGIVGVPWQDLARQNALGVPDLDAGLDEQGNPVGGLKSAAELGSTLPGSSNNVWDLVVGDPANNVPPADPFMIESMAPRAGANPITGDAIVPPSATGWNAINGREYTIPGGGTGDLQYACIFDVEERECAGNTQSCDCREIAGQATDNPLCAPQQGNDPADPSVRTTTQIKAKAYPGIRELRVLKSLGDQAIAGSICPAQTNDPDSELGDFGYTPVIRAVLERLDASL